MSSSMTVAPRGSTNAAKKAPAQRSKTAVQTPIPIGKWDGEEILKELQQIQVASTSPTYRLQRPLAESLDGRSYVSHEEAAQQVVAAVRAFIKSEQLPQGAQFSLYCQAVRLYVSRLTPDTKLRALITAALDKERPAKK